VHLTDIMEQTLTASSQEGVYNVTSVKKEGTGWDELRNHAIEAERSSREISQSTGNCSAPAPCPSSSTSDFSSAEERDFWMNLSQPRVTWNASDIPLSLFSADSDALNLGTLRSLLNQLSNCSSSTRVSVGEFKSFHPWRPETQDLYGVYYLHYGGPCTWYAVTSQFSGQLEDLMKELFPQFDRGCAAFWRHEGLLVRPDVLLDRGIEVHTAVQKEGELLVVFPAAHHCRFTHGLSVMEAVNFAPLDWVPFGITALTCTCARKTAPPVDSKRLLPFLDVRASVAVFSQWPGCDWLDGDYFLQDNPTGMAVFVRETGSRLHLFYQLDIAGWQISSTLAGDCARAFVPGTSPQLISGLDRWMALDPSTGVWQEQDVRVEHPTLDLFHRKPLKADRHYLKGSYQLQGMYHSRPYYVRIGSSGKPRTSRGGPGKAAEEETEEYPTLFLFRGNDPPSWQVASQLGSGAARAYNNGSALVPHHLAPSAWKYVSPISKRWESVELPILVRVPQQSPACLLLHADAPTTMGAAMPAINGWYELGGVWGGRAYYVRRSVPEALVVWHRARREWQLTTALGTGDPFAYCSHSACSPCDVTTDWQLLLSPHGPWQAAHIDIQGHWECLSIQSDEDLGADLSTGDAVLFLRGLHDGRVYYGNHPGPGLPPDPELFLYWVRSKEKWVIGLDLGSGSGLLTVAEDVPVPWLVLGPWRLQEGTRKARNVSLSFADAGSIDLRPSATGRLADSEDDAVPAKKRLKGSRPSK